MDNIVGRLSNIGIGKYLEHNERLLIILSNQVVILYYLLSMPILFMFSLFTPAIFYIIILFLLVHLPLITLLLNQKKYYNLARLNLLITLSILIFFEAKYITSWFIFFDLLLIVLLYFILFFKYAHKKTFWNTLLIAIGIVYIFSINPLFLGSSIINFNNTPTYYYSIFFIKSALITLVYYLFIKTAIPYLKNITQKLTTTNNLLRSKLKKINTVINNNPIITFTLNNKGICTNINGKAFNTPNVNYSHILGKPMIEMCKEDYPEVLTLIYELLNGNSVNKTLNISHKYISIYGSAIFNKKNEVIGCTGFLIDISSHHHQQDNNNKLSMVAKHTTDIVIITDKNGYIEWVNTAFENVTGYALNEVINKKPSLLQGKNTNPNTVKNISQKLKQQIAFTVEIINYTKANKEYWIEMNITPIFNEQKELVNFIAIETDISKRKETDLWLERLLLIAQKSANNIIISDANYCIEWINDSVETKSGFSLTECKGKKSYFLYGNKIDKEIIVYLDSKVSEKIPFQIELMSYNKQGLPRWIELHVTPVFNKEQELINFITIENEITTRKNTEKELQFNKQLFENIFEASEDFIALAAPTPELTFIKVNKKAIEMFNLNTKSDLENKPAHLPRKYPISAATIEKRNKIIEEQGWWKEEVEYCSKPEECFWGLLSSKLFFIDDKPYHLVRITDITAQKINEQKINKQKIFYEAIINNIPIHIAVFNAQKEFILINQNILDPEYQKEWLIGKTYAEYTKNKNINPEILKQREQVLEKCIEQKKTLEIEETITQKNGTKTALLTLNTPIFDAEGRLQMIITYGLDITERKNIAQTLKEQHKFYEAILDNIPLELLVLKPDLTIIYTNKALIPDKSTKTAIIGKTLNEINPEIHNIYPNLKNNIPLIKKSIETQKNQHYEEEITNKQGNKQFYIKTIAPVINSQNNIMFIVNFGLDITERKNIEQTVKEQKQFYESIIDNLPVHLAVFSPDIKFVYTNKIAITDDVARVWAVGKTIQEWAIYKNVNPTIIKERIKLIQNAINTKSVHAAEEKLIDNKLNTLYFLRTAAPMFDLNGSIKGVVSFGVNITELKKTEQELAYNKTLFETIFNEATDAITIIDPETNTVLKANKSANILFETNYENKLINPLNPIFQKQPFTNQQFKEINDTLKEKLFWNSEIEYLTTKGNSFWGAIAIKHVNINNQILELVRITNISPQKNAELQLRNYANNLIKANSELQRSNNDLQEFAYIASHDLKTPLRNISGHIQLLQLFNKDNLDENSLNLIKEALKFVNNLDNLISGLLEYSKINQDTSKLTPINLNDIITIIKENLFITLSEKNAQIISEQLPQVTANKTQMIQLFQNLISNGIKYNTEKQPTITISYNNLNQKYYQFFIHDNGIGIEEQYQTKIFTIFKRLHSQKDYEGTGIGLSICKKIVELYGGSISINSELGKGATFIFTLPK